MKTFYQLLITHFDVLQVRRFIQIQFGQIPALLFCAPGREFFGNWLAIRFFEQAVVILHTAICPSLVTSFPQLPGGPVSRYVIGPKFFNFFLVHALEIVPASIICRRMLETEPIVFI